MVFPALLRDPEGVHLQLPVDRREAVGRHRDVRIDRVAVLPALARQLAGQIVDLSSAVPHLLLDPRRRRAAPRLVRYAARGTALGDPQPAGCDLLFRSLPGYPSYRVANRTPASDAEFYHRTGLHQTP